MKTLKIFGPPGTGKTYTLLQLFEEELKAVKPERICFLTFTRAARLEALSRASLTEEELPYVKTIHSTCYKALNVHQDQLVLRKHLGEFGRSIGVQLTGFMPDLFALESVTEAFRQPTKADRLLQLNHLGRHRGLKLKETLKDAPQELDFKYALWFTKAYREWKTAKGLVDYTDLLTDYLEKGNPLDADVMFIDEAQDLSWLQWQVVHRLGSRCQRIYLCGDDDQAIFVWAGASSSMFLLEPADETRVLPQSYRIPRRVHELSQKIIKRVKIRHDKEFRPREAEGEVRPIGRLDIPHVTQGTGLVLFRNYHRGVALALQLEELAIPFLGMNSVLANDEARATLRAWQKAEKHEPLTMPEARAMVSYAVGSALEAQAPDRVKPTTGELSVTALLTAKALEQPWWQAAAKLPKLGYLQRVVKTYGWDAVLKPAVTLLSIHQCKGREADTVVLDLELARRTYEAYRGQGADDEERVFYVATTRAKERLLTLLPTDAMHYQL